MGDRVRVRLPEAAIYFGKLTNQAGQLSLLPSVGRYNEYQPKGGDVSRLGSKGRHGVICR